MTSTLIDLAQLRVDHGTAQATAETRLRRSVGNLYGTTSLVQGHRVGFWDGITYVLELQAKVQTLSAGEVVRELRKHEGSIYWPIFVEDPRCWVICDRCDHRVLIDAEGLCPECNNDFDV